MRGCGLLVLGRSLGARRLRPAPWALGGCGQLLGVGDFVDGAGGGDGDGTGTGGGTTGSGTTGSGTTGSGTTGGGPVKLVDSGDASVMALAGSSIFWVETDGTIWRVSLDGSTVESVAGAPGSTTEVHTPVAVVAEAESVGSRRLWADGATKKVYRVDGTNQAAVECVATGCEVGATTDLALDQAVAWWTGPAGLSKFPLGLGGTANVISGPMQPRAVAAAGQDAYVAQDLGDFWNIAEVQPSSVNPDFVTGLEEIRDLATDGSNLFWAVPGGIGGRSLGSDGTVKDLSLGVTPDRLAPDPGSGGYVYWMSIAERQVGRVDKGLTGSEDVRTLDTEPCDVAVSAHAVFWLAGGAIWRLEKP
jgi:hypothetical protein